MIIVTEIVKFEKGTKITEIEHVTATDIEKVTENELEAAVLGTTVVDILLHVIAVILEDRWMSLHEAVIENGIVNVSVLVLLLTVRTVANPAKRRRPNRTAKSRTRTVIRKRRRK